MYYFRLPELGYGLTEAELVQWHVNLGDTVAADQILCSVETQKGAVELCSVFPGRVVDLYGDPGDIACVGAPLLALDVPAIHKRKRGTGLNVKAVPAVRALARHRGVDLTLFHHPGLVMRS